MNKKILYRYLPSFFFVFVLFVFTPIVSSAETMADIPWVNTSASASSSYTYQLRPSDGTLNTLTTSTAYVQYYEYPEYVLNFRFTAQDVIFLYPCTNLAYQFNLSWSDPNFSINSAEYYLIHDGTQYPLYSDGNLTSGWLQKLTIYGSNTYIDIKVVLHGEQYINNSFTRTQFDNDTTVTLNKSNTFSLTMNMFTQYESEDNVLVMSNNIDKLVNDAAGIQGAIENQTQQSIQNTEQITNGYNSSQMGDAEYKFESGAGDLTDIEDTLSDSSSTYVDNFTTTGFDTSFLQSVGPSLNYVVTWFTNFWNIGGGLTATFILSFAIYIAFYILRVRG